MNYFLIILTTIAGLIGWFKPKKTPRWLKIAIFILLLLCGGIQVFLERDKTHKEDTAKLTGLLNSAPGDNRQMPGRKRLDIGWTVDETGYSFEFQNSVSEVFRNALPANKRFLQVLEDISFEYNFRNQQLEVSMLIRDSKGYVVASIERNEWKVAPPPKIFDRNFSKDILEIINDKGQVVLQVRALKNAIQLNGIFYGANGYGMAVYPVHKESVKIRMVMLGPDSNPDIRMDPIFRYPSELHLGEFQNRP
jgi:hypothetical protein